MAWSTPSLKDVRKMVRDFVVGNLPGADASVPNRVLRVMSDVQAGLAHLVLQYIDWLSLMLLPLTAAGEWLDRHGIIWLTNADGSKGRKAATYAAGSATFTGTVGLNVPSGTQIGKGIVYETLANIVLDVTPVAASIRALTAGAAGNQDAGTSLSLVSAIAGVDSNATVVSLTGGADAESDEDLRLRVLDRIQEPPMGGDANDYVQWAEQFAGVTRAFSAPLEMGIGTVTVRFMMDSLRATSDPSTSGFPLAGDVSAVLAYLNTKRPVAIKDFFVVAPIPQTISFTINNLDPDTSATRSAIQASVAAMIKEKGRPNIAINGVAQGAQTIYESWITEAAMQAAGVSSFDLSCGDFVMPTNGHIAVMGTISYAP